MISMTQRLLLVDDHSVLLSGIAHMLNHEPDFEICGMATSGKEAILKSGALHPDLIVMDISMPDMDGIETTRAIKTASPDTKVLMLTMFSEEDYLKKALEAGASGYVLKKALDTELVSAIHTVLKGETYIYPSMTAHLLRAYVPKADSAPEEVHLSDREKEVLAYLALGYTYKEMAEEMFISEKTVETHKARLSEKLSMRKRSELVRYAVKNGLVEF